MNLWKSAIQVIWTIQDAQFGELYFRQMLKGLKIFFILRNGSVWKKLNSGKFGNIIFEPKLSFLRENNKNENEGNF